MLEAVEVSKKYWDRSSGRQYDVLQSCSLQIAAGEAVGLMGPSGCGKSTLARVLLRLLPTDSGRIIFQAQDVTQLSQKQLKPFRQQVQFISQRPESFFDPLLKLGASLREPLHIFDLPDSSEIIEAALATVKLSPALLDRYPHQVSGGEIQRLSIARALLLKPRLLILDEPTSMLDISVQAQILQLLQSIRQQEQMAFLFISHDKAIINYMCDRQLYMQEGRIT
ncbi:ABC transporter ATP-binding protein [Phascolarctobacterium faecium]|uniref:ABC transporter ATP-binding protein n=1 Tax=Phascolarctobacterium faecium TaxID=33025 RepID=UPI00210DD083|nr:dipeptide/oligopeptide/nickel ABC transporter ATP-binding protein [Phascolarctobacterium faecium]MCQ5183229.1 dipeptide/oligopeptide/nickel ABC transporter ATP-binding protein [Phascolarctobacterium faecium]